MADDEGLDPVVALTMAYLTMNYLEADTWMTFLLLSMLPKPRRTKPNTYAVHHGPGLYQDYEVLFSSDAQDLPRRQHRKLLASFRKTFRMEVEEFEWIVFRLTPELNGAGSSIVADAICATTPLANVPALARV